MQYDRHNQQPQLLVRLSVETGHLLPESHSARKATRDSFLGLRVFGPRPAPHEADNAIRQDGVKTDNFPRKSHPFLQ
jgi:hypothetical protein